MSVGLVAPAGLEAAAAAAEEGGAGLVAVLVVGKGREDTSTLAEDCCRGTVCCPQFDNTAD